MISPSRSLFLCRRARSAIWKPISSIDSRSFSKTRLSSLTMKPGTELISLAICKGQDPPTVLPREEYPSWISELTKPLPSLAVLRRIPNEEAKDPEILRYLKLTRRLGIRQRNEERTT